MTRIRDERPTYTDWNERLALALERLYTQVQDDAEPARAARTSSLSELEAINLSVAGIAASQATLALEVAAIKTAIVAIDTKLGTANTSHAAINTGLGTINTTLAAMTTAIEGIGLP